MNKIPNLFIVGAAKSGSTSLYQYLSQHPEVYMSPEKEPNFFLDNSLKLNDNVKDMKTYLYLFSKSSGEKLIGEGSVRYLDYSYVPDKIRKFNPESKILIILRNPIDMVYSLYYQNISSGYAKAERKVEKNVIPVKRGMYYEKVKSYIDIFGDNVKIIIFDDFVSDASVVYSDICSFLGIDRSFSPDFNIHNPSSAPRIVWLNRLVKLIKRKIPMSFRMRVLVNARPIFKISSFIVGMNSRMQKYPPMSEDLRDELKKTFSYDIERLGKLIGRDLSSWAD